MRAALYDAVVARYSLPAIATLGHLLLPNLFPELSAFATVEDLVSHLRTSDARYCAALPADFLAKNPPPMYINIYFIVTRLPDSLRAVRDHFLVLDPKALTVDLLEQHLLVVETSVVVVGAAHGTPCTPFFEGCSPSPIAHSYASAADVPGAEDFRAAYASAKRRSSKCKGGRGGGGGSGGGGGGSGGGGGGSGGGGSGGSGGGSGGFGGGCGGSGGSGGSGSGGSGGGWTRAQRGGSGGGPRQQQQRRSETPSPKQLRDRAGQTCGKPRTQHRCFSRLDDAWRAEFGDEAEHPRWAELRRSGVAIFDLDYDAILAAMYALSVSAEGDCYLCVPPDPGIEAAALGASESVLPSTAPAEALHTFTLDSGASRCLFRDSTTLTPLSAPVPVRLADPSGGPILARSSTALPCPAVQFGSLSGLHLPQFSTNLVSTAALQDAMVTTTTHGGQRVSICTCTRTGHHLATFTRQPGSSLYTLATEPPHVAVSAQVSASGQPSLPRLRGMHSRLLVSGLPRSLPPLPPSPTPPCLPCIEGRQRAAPHSSSIPPQLVPCRLSTWTCGAQTASVDRVASAIFCWLLTTTRVCLQLYERFLADLPVLRLHYDRGDSPQQNGIAERRIGLVMEVARTSMIHADAPHFLWPFAGPAPSGVSNMDPLPGTASVEVAVGSGAASVGADSGDAERGGDESEGDRSGGAEPGGAETGGAEPEGVEPGGAEPKGVEPGGAESGGAERRGTVSSAGPAGALPRLSPRPEPLSLQQLREWFAQRTRLRSGAAGAGDSAAGDIGAGGAGVTAGAGGTGGAAAAGPGGARTRGTGAAGTGGVGGAGAGDPTEPRAAGTRGAGD
ncbi:unnamed protein product [Closterium sp. NIES-54]